MADEANIAAGDEWPTDDWPVEATEEKSETPQTSGTWDSRHAPAQTSDGQITDSRSEQSRNERNTGDGAEKPRKQPYINPNRFRTGGAERVRVNQSMHEGNIKLTSCIQLFLLFIISFL